MKTSGTAGLGLAGRLAHAFLNSKLTPLFVVASLALGILSVIVIPREEDPQILVPMLDIATAMPGASPAEVEERVTLPIERLVHQIPGVEYVYSTSSPGMSLVIVRFLVGTPQEDALIKVYSKLYSNFDQIPPGITQPIIKARSIDDVPILSLTLWGEHYNGCQLRAIADEIQHNLQQIPDVSESNVIGGLPRTMRVMLNTAKLNAYGQSPLAIVGRLQAANASLQAGSFAENNREIRIDAGNLFTSRQDLESVVVAVDHGRPVYLRDVADQIIDGPSDPANYVLFGTTNATAGAKAPQQFPAVSITLAKRKGTNATDIANAALKRIDEMKGVQIPNDVNVTTTRNYGDTAKAKSDELLEHLLLATLSVTLLIALFLGWRESGVVLLAIPVTLALTMSIFYFLGYTINRVTLFALIFSIGILVDDAIVVVENIVRHFRLKENQHRSPSDITVEAVAEVGNPTILATFAVIAAVLPMAFVRGLMGPYMRPIPVGSSAAMIFSLIVAFVVSPWAAMRLLGKHLGGAHLLEPEHENWRTRIYRKVMAPLIASARNRLLFFVAVIGLLLLSAALVPWGAVRVKMLPFDNKSELQVVINMPDGTPLEQTLAVTQALGTELSKLPDVLNYQLYAGTSGPFNFNGLVRHYYMRRMPNQADIQVNFVPAGQRKEQSHAIARRLRPLLVAIGNQYGARIQVSEVPPGPPVIQTLVAEVYGPDLDGQTRVAQQIKSIFQHTPGVVDTDWYVEDPQPRLAVQVDSVKAAQHGIAVADVAKALALATSGMEVGLVHDPNAREPIPATVQLTRADRSSEQALQDMHLPAADGTMVSLRELVTVEHDTIQRSIYHKNLRRVVYVTGDVAGAEESPVYAILKMNKDLDQLKLPAGYTLARYNANMPESTDHYSMKWDGEWHITIEVFRDLGLAFATVLLLIYVLVVGWFRSFVVPLIIMAPIPLTLIGILPAHAIMGAFFTATSMIGFIAGAGIIVRNSIILVDFIELRRAQGAPLADAVIDAGAIRFRPMLLTAAAVVVGASVILTDPIFQGLAVSLMAGAIASTFLSWPTIPILYYMVHRKAETAVASETKAYEGVAQ
ncbi:efflux RND transporter permease subunit [Occallatibacter riparius]|uniref:Efflux RND transporter permease subunit n=1 Tax=Occallatibacter riparius TaxID=1002689 RepID=A0A9J7BN57_9BACT|nr:efflux RND transporter permease subunit [Occallatibacter riparius]UWZ83194.1 efflux RND transporter permease subunit [Occallatibacter riparius]